MTEPYGVTVREPAPAPLPLKKTASTGRSGSVPALGFRKDAVKVGEEVVKFYSTYLRIRPYSPWEAGECHKSGLDTGRSVLEMDVEKDTVFIQEPATLRVKNPAAAPPKKSWHPSLFTNLLWSFGRDDVEHLWADDVKHTFAEQRSVYDVVSQYDGIVKSLYDGFSQCIMVHGAPGSGKTYTCIGEQSDPGIAPRAITNIFNSRKTRVKSRPGEKIKVVMRVLLLRLWKENIEDLTNSLHDPNKPPVTLKLTGEGILEGHEEVVVENDNDLLDLLKRVHKLGKRREKRSHAIINVTLEQISNFEGDGAATEAVRCSCMTFVDIGSGVKTENESQNDGKLIVKSRTALLRVVDMLRNKTEVEVQAEKVNAEYGQGNLKVMAPKVPFKESRLTQLLADQLGGNCQTHIICCVSPFHKHNVDNSMTIDFGRVCSQIRSRTHKKESKDLVKLRNQNDEKLKITKQVTLMNENVEKVQKVLLDRQKRINYLKQYNTRLHEKLAELEEAIEALERERIQSGKAIQAIRTMKNSGDGEILTTKMSAAIKEQEDIRRKIAKLKQEIMAMEVEAGMMTSEDLDKDIELAKADVDAEKRVCYEAIQSDARQLINKDDDEDEDNLMPIGGTITLKRRGTWNKVTVRSKVSDTKYTVAGTDGTGKFTEEVDLSASDGQIRGHKSHPSNAGDAPVKKLLHFLCNESVAEECPGLEKMVKDEIEAETEIICKPFDGRPLRKDLKVLLAAATPEFVTKVLKAIKTALPNCSSKTRDRVAGSFKKSLENCVETISPRCDNAKQADKALDYPSLKGVTLFSIADDDKPLALHGVTAAIDALQVPRTRLDILYDYLQARLGLESALADWQQTMTASFVAALEITKEAEQADKQRAQEEAELKKLKEESEALEQQLEAAAAGVVRAREAKNDKEKLLHKAKNDGCCVMM